MNFPKIRILEGVGHLPISFQIKNNLKHAISSGHLEPNTQLPSVRDLASQLNVAANTVARAYKELQDEGLLITYAGRGTFVADLVQNRRWNTDDQQTLQGILQPAIASVRAIGYSEEQIVDAVQELLGQSSLHIGLIGINETIVKKWQQILEEELADLQPEVLAFTVAELRDDFDLVNKQLSSSYYLFTLITSYPETRIRFQGLNKRVVALITEVSMKTHQQLAELPPDQPIGLICEDMYVNNLMSLIEPYVATERIQRVSPDDVSDVRELMASVNYVLHTLTPKKLVMGLAVPAQHLIEIEFLPNRSCFDQIRQMLLRESVPA
ncbi:MAG: GntR family transcriptional regulator [Caldilineaceae bacterium]|nr:GntR family transcriptional regulator [Caldilineaceae bacterium]